MMPHKHFIYAVGLSIIFYLTGTRLFPIALIIISSVLIDIDHVFDYFFKFNTYSREKVKKYLRKDVDLKNTNKLLPIFIFHNIETLIGLLILYAFFPILIYIFMGVFIHLLLDWKVLSTHRHPFIIKTSLLLVLIENSRRKKGAGKW